MKMARAAQPALLALVTLLMGASAARTSITPVQQVLTMMTEMKATGEKMMQKEQKTYAEYSEWVDDRTTELGFEIKTATTKIEELTAFADVTDSKAAKLGEEISALDGEIARMEGEKKDATAVRAGEHEEYLKLSQDYSESVDALGRAIDVLSSQAYDRSQAEMLLQRMAKTTPGMGRVLAALLQEKDSVRSAGAPAVAAYKFQSDNIVKLLESLLAKFKGELSDVEEQESNQAHYYNLEVLHLSDTIAKSKSDREEKAADKSSSVAASAKAKGEIAETKNAMAEDQKFLADMKATFAAKSATFKENQAVREQELEAISKALEIISSPSVADSYAEHVNLAQVGSRASPAAAQFLQTRSSKRRVAARQLAAEYLQRRAKALNSRVLASFAVDIAANPFAKVVTMIKDLLARLKEEAAAEAEHKEWCDEQLKDNKIKRDKKTASVNKLTAEIAMLTDSIEEMGKDIATLVKEQQDLTKAMTEATAQRSKEKAENLDTAADAKAGAEAVKKALVILQEFYSSQASLLQERQVPEMKAYGGMQSGKGGIIGMLEVIQTDFMRLEADTNSAEDQAAKEYDGFMTDAKEDKKTKHEQEVKLRLEKDQAEFEKSQTEKDLAGNQEELDRANGYFAELKPSCLEIHVSYEERAARRKEELAALNEAYGILDSKGSA